MAVHMVGGMAICGGSEDVREGRIGIGGGCGTIGGTLAPAISGRRNHDATEAHTSIMSPALAALGDWSSGRRMRSGAPITLPLPVLNKDSVVR